MWDQHMKSLKTRKLILEIEDKLPDVIDEWYIRKGESSPLWRQRKPYFDEEGNIVRP